MRDAGPANAAAVLFQEHPGRIPERGQRAWRHTEVMTRIQDPAEMRGSSFLEVIEVLREGSFKHLRCCKNVSISSTLVPSRASPMYLKDALTGRYSRVASRYQNGGHGWESRAVAIVKQRITWARVQQKIFSSETASLRSGDLQRRKAEESTDQLWLLCATGATCPQVNEKPSHLASTHQSTP